MKPKTLLSLMLVAFASVLLTGCPDQQQKPVPTRDKPDVISVLDARVAALRTLSAKLSMKVRLPGMHSSEDLSASFSAAGPNRLRLKARHALLDYVPLDIGCDGASWWVCSHYEDTNRVDYGRLAELDRLNIDVPLRPDQIVALLGMTPLRDNPPFSNWVFTVESGEYLLQEIVREDSSRYVATRIRLDGNTCLIHSYETLLPNGRTDMIATLSDYKTIDNVPVPRKISIRLLGRKEPGKLDIILGDVQVNPSLPPNVFRTPDFESIPQRFHHPLPATPPHAALPASHLVSLKDTP